MHYLQFASVNQLFLLFCFLAIGIYTLSCHSFCSMTIIIPMSDSAIFESILKEHYGQKANFGSKEKPHYYG